MAIDHIDADDLRRMLRERPDDLEIIDVRSRKEYDEMHIRGSRLIPAEEFAERAMFLSTTVSPPGPRASWRRPS